MQLQELMAEDFAFELPVIPERTYRITDFAAVSDGRTLNTDAFRKAIDACAEAGGGTVLVPEGEWLTGPIHLKSRIRLHLEKGAVLRFSGRFEDYLPVVFTRWEGIECYNYSPLIYANGCEHIALTGEGRLEGSGEAWWSWKKTQHDSAKVLYDAEHNGLAVKDRVFGVENGLRPQFVQPINCSHVLIEGVTLVNGPFWTIHPVYCENLTVRGVTFVTNGPNTDGLNPDSCRNVLIEQCKFETGDDCIAINSGMNEDGWRVNKPCENIVVRNCHMNEGHGGVVIGSGMSGGVRNVYVKNCRFTGGDRGIRLKSMRGRGGFVENVWFEDIEITDMRNEAVVVNMFYESTTIEPRSQVPPRFENITIRNIRGRRANVGVGLYGLPECPLKTVRLENVDLTAKTPLASNHVDGLVMRNVTLNEQE